MRSPVPVPDDLLGRRVSLRHRIGDRDGRPLYSDAVGEISADGDALVVVTRRGPVRVARAAVAAVRAVPPAAPRRASWAAVARLESLCADAWPAVVDEPLGDWRLRATGGVTARANSALAVGDPGVPVASALDAVVAFAREHRITPRVQVPTGSPWDRAAGEQGWVLDAGHRAGAEVAVLVADLDRLAGTSPGDGIGFTDRASTDWWAVGGGPAGPVERALVDPGPPLRTGFGLATGGVVRAALVEDHLHLSRLQVHPPSRRTGVGTALTAAAARWGRDRGARWAVLQVALGNTAARALYERLGCTEHHRYHYLVRG